MKSHSLPGQVEFVRGNRHISKEAMGKTLGSSAPDLCPAIETAVTWYGSASCAWTGLTTVVTAKNRCARKLKSWISNHRKPPKSLKNNRCLTDLTNSQLESSLSFPRRDSSTRLSPELSTTRTRSISSGQNRALPWTISTRIKTW